MNDVSKRPLQGTPWLQLQTEGEESMNPGARRRGPSPTRQVPRDNRRPHDAFSLESLMAPRRLHYVSSRLFTFLTDAPFGGDASHSLPRCCA